MCNKSSIYLIYCLSLFRGVLGGKGLLTGLTVASVREAASKLDEFVWCGLFQQLSGKSRIRVQVIVKGSGLPPRFASVCLVYALVMRPIKVELRGFEPLTFAVQSQGTITVHVCRRSEKPAKRPVHLYGASRSFATVRVG
jgi:hypothetical protein